MDFFTCKTCGAHKLTVEHTYTRIETSTLQLDCTCGAAPDGIAAVQVRKWAIPCSEWGPLEDDHDWKPGDKEEEKAEELEGSLEVFCQSCVDAAAGDESAWDLVGPDSENGEKTGEEFFVRCEGCNREIEFGWSHPGRGGRIWPAECTDFNPWKAWPEPRYRDSWAQKNWLPPGI